MSTELNKEEEIQQRAFNLGLTLQLLGYLKPHRGHVILAFGTIVLAAGFGQVGPYITQVAVDDYIAVGDWAGLRWMIAAFFGSVAVQYGAQYAQTLVTGMIGQRVMYDMRRDLFAHLQKLPLRYFDRTPLGRIMTRATNDIDALNEFFSEGVVSVFMDFFTLLAIVGFMAYIDFELALICCTVVPIIAVSTFYLQNLAMRAYRELRTRLARLNAYLQENITGMEVVQLFNRQQRNLRDFDAEHLPYRRAEDREIHCFAIFFPFTELLGTVGMALVLWYGASNVIDGRIELGVLVAFLQYIRRFFRPIMDISDRYALLQSAMAASERIFEMLAVPSEPTGGPSAELRASASSVESSKPRRKLPAANRGGAIEFRNVFFKYDPAAEDWILKDVSFELQAGQSLALVGATGSGKTTIVSLLCRFYDIQRGEILVDGRDVRQWHAAELRRRISIVQQEVFLFSGNISGNIRLGEDAIDDAQVERAARYVNAAPFIERLPQGFAHAVAEGGSTLSAGQRQLLAFARALAFDPEILVLDEATSSIDTETEQLIQDAIAKLMSERTSIVIAHRLSTIRSADQILVMHRGKVRERGRHEELLLQDGIYARLYRLNYGRS